MYYYKYTVNNSMIEYLWSVKFLRNAAAHNSCLINSFKIPYTVIRKNKQINTYISKVKGIKPEERQRKMDNPIIHDFIVTLYVLTYMISSDKTRKSAIIELKELMDNRFTKHKEYFEKNQIIRTNYKFVKKVVDYFFEMCI